MTDRQHLAPASELGSEKIPKLDMGVHACHPSTHSGCLPAISALGRVSSSRLSLLWGDAKASLGSTVLSGLWGERVGTQQ